MSVKSNMNGNTYNDRELSNLFAEIKSQLSRIEEDNVEGFRRVHERQDIANSKVNKHTKILLVVGSVVGALLMTSGSELLDFILKVI